MSKHTPGPWKLQNETIYALDENGVVNRFSVSVQEGYVRSSRNYMHNVRTPKAELQANARLIAAAPDMLKALVGLSGILATAESNASGNPEWEYVSARINAARAAIAAATGEV